MLNVGDKQQHKLLLGFNKVIPWRRYCNCRFEAVPKTGKLCLSNIDACVFYESKRRTFFLENNIFVLELLSSWANVNLYPRCVWLHIACKIGELMTTVNHDFDMNFDGKGKEHSGWSLKFLWNLKEFLKLVEKFVLKLLVFLCNLFIFYVQ